MSYCIDFSWNVCCRFFFFFFSSRRRHTRFDCDWSSDVCSSDLKAVELPIKIGVIGFTTPGIMNWDKRYLEGKLYTEGAVESAQKYLPEMRAKGADVVVAMLHGGLDGARSEEHTSELQSQSNLVCRLLLEKKKK